MKLIKNKLKDSSGSAMILVILVVTMVMATVALVSTQVNNQIIGNRNTREQVTMRYSAEAGVEKTIADVCSQLEKGLNNLSYEPPGDPGGDLEDNAVYKYLVRVGDNLKLAAIEYNPGDNDNNDVWIIYNRVKSILSMTTPDNKLDNNANRTDLKNEINYILQQINNIRSNSSYNDRRANSVDNYLETSIHYLKLSLYTLNRIGTCSMETLTGDYVANLRSINLNEIKTNHVDKSKTNLSQVKTSIDNIPSKYLSNTKKEEMTTLIQNYGQNINLIEARFGGALSSQFSNLESDLKNNKNGAEDTLKKTIMEIESTILKANEGILNCQVELYKFKEDTFKDNEERKEPSIINFQKAVETVINELEIAEEGLIELKCKLGKPNSTGEINQEPNPNLLSNIPNKIEVNIQEFIMDIGNNIIYKRYGFIIEVPIGWQTDGNGGYELKDIPDINQDIVSEGFINGDATKIYKIKANVTFDVQKGDDGKLYINYRVNSWDKI